VSLSETISGLFAEGTRADKAAARAAFFELQQQLSQGYVRAAEPDAAAATGWRVNAWVKQGILLGFRFGDTVDVSADHGRWPFYDKDTMPLKKPGVAAGVRIVPGGSTIREGAVVKQRAVLAAGVILTASTPIYDLPHGVIIRAAEGQPLVVPEGAVVVPGARAVSVGAGKEWGLSLATPVIVKYRDDRTDTRTELETWIR
jgi:tetrahydrodipicolinate N-succinyltransferase